MLIEPIRAAQQPTRVPPGPDRIDVYADRYAHGEKLFHKHDYREPRYVGFTLTPTDLDRLANSPVAIDEDDE